MRSASAALAIQLGCKLILWVGFWNRPLLIWLFGRRYLVAHIEYLNGLDESFGENGLESTERCSFQLNYTSAPLTSIVLSQA